MGALSDRILSSVLPSDGWASDKPKEPGLYFWQGGLVKWPVYLVEVLSAPDFTGVPEKDRDMNDLSLPKALHVAGANVEGYYEDGYVPLSKVKGFWHPDTKNPGYPPGAFRTVRSK